MNAALFLAVLPAVLPGPGDAKVTFDAPDYYVAGAPFRVRLNLEAPADGATLAGAQLTQAAFTVDGKTLAEPGSFDPLQLKGDEKKTIEMDLASHLEVTGDFQLGWGALPARKVRVLEAAPKDVKFLDEAALPSVELTQYWVLLRTNRADILLELWPDAAPNHVRNFLDLSATGFYDDLTFHRVIPNFMIQGGDPDGNGSGSGPRRLKAEFTDRKHVRGVLSMARSQAPHTATSQFFIMHADNPDLDGQYSAFGKVITGLEVVDRIATAPTAGKDRPRSPQVIERAVVIRAPSDPAAWKAQK